MTIKTLLLSSRNLVSGTPGDCYIDIKDRTLLDNHKKYVCRLKWLHLSRPLEANLDTNDVRNIYVLVDGIYFDDTYSTDSIVPLACLNVGAWRNGTDKYIEPLDHVRVVRVNQSMLRIRFFDPDEYVYVGQFVTGWALEMQFQEIEE